MNKSDREIWIIENRLKDIIISIWAIMIDGNIAAIAFNKFYDKWRWPLPSKKVMAIITGLLFPPFTLLFCFCAALNLCIFPIVWFVSFILKGFRKTKSQKTRND